MVGVWDVKYDDDVWEVVSVDSIGVGDVGDANGGSVADTVGVGGVGVFGVSCYWWWYWYWLD